MFLWDCTRIYKQCKTYDIIDCYALSAAHSNLPWKIHHYAMKAVSSHIPSQLCVRCLSYPNMEIWFHSYVKRQIQHMKRFHFTYQWCSLSCRLIVQYYTNNCRLCSYHIHRVPSRICHHQVPKHWVSRDLPMKEQSLWTYCYQNPR